MIKTILASTLGWFFIILWKECELQKIIWAKGFFYWNWK